MFLSINLTQSVVISSFFFFGRVTWHVDLPRSGIDAAPPAVEVLSQLLGHQGNPPLQFLLINGPSS